MRSFIVYLPCLLTYPYIISEPEKAYWIAWLGSWFILFVTIFGIAQSRPKDLGFFEQFFRPYMYIQIIFAIYNCLSSIFYFFHLKGFMFSDRIGSDITLDAAFSIANAQFYCLLAHAAYAQGLVINIPKYEKQKINFTINLSSSLLAKSSIVLMLIAIIIQFSGSLSAISSNLIYMSLVTATLSLVRALSEKKNILFSSTLFLMFLLLGLTTGMKETLIIPLLILIISLFPRYKLQTILFIILASNVIIYLPAYTKNVREIVWYGNGTVIDALELTYENAVSEDLATKELNKKTQWAFLAFRFSEISMLEQFINHVPAQRNFYGSEILLDGLSALVPKGLRLDGKSIDETAMERTYEAGVLDRFIGAGGTSAKPSIVADNYLIGGSFAIIIMFLFYGWFVTFMSLLCEKTLGGYTLGTAIVANAILAVFQKGNATENVFSSISYGILLYIILYFLAKHYYQPK